MNLPPCGQITLIHVQSGLHLSELAKTRWNASVCSGVPLLSSEVEAIRAIVAYAREVLTVYGIEGDEEGPLDELRTLENLLLEEKRTG